jgi:hypothetical protein
MGEISTVKGTLVIVAMVGGIVAYAKWPERPRKHEPPPALAVIDAGWVITTGTQRCQVVVTEKWCDEIDPRLPNITRRQETRSRVRTDNCAERERKRKSRKREKGLLDYGCTATWKDIKDEMCRSERLAWTPLTTSEQEIHDRRPPPAPPAPRPPECGTPACGDGCTAPLERGAAQVVWVKRVDDGSAWRCPAEPGPWNIAEPGRAFTARLAACARAP